MQMIGYQMALFSSVPLNHIIVAGQSYPRGCTNEHKLANLGSDKDSNMLTCIVDKVGKRHMAIESNL